LCILNFKLLDSTGKQTILNSIAAGIPELKKFSHFHHLHNFDVILSALNVGNLSNLKGLASNLYIMILPAF